MFNAVVRNDKLIENSFSNLEYDDTKLVFSFITNFKTIVLVEF